MRVQWIAHNGKGRGSRIIMKATRGDVSHVSLRFRDLDDMDRHVLQQSTGILFTYDHEIEAIQGAGVRHQQFVPSQNQTWYDFDHTPEQALRIALFAAAQIGKPYDWKGIWGFATRNDWENPDKWFCSELASAALLNAGIRLLWLPSYKQSPTVATASPILSVAPDSPNKPAGR